MRWLIEKIANALVKWCEKNNRIFKITGGPNGETVYLVRYIVFKSRLGCIYIHRFMRTDADDPHDHPWNFWTYVISGGYVERYYDKSKPNKDETKYTSFWTWNANRREPGSLAYRKATDIHVVKTDKERAMDEIKDAPYTLCLMGPRIRDWGFWTEDGAKFQDWRSYLNMSPNDARSEGSE